MQNDYCCTIGFIKHRIRISQLAQNAETPDNRRIQSHTHRC